MAYCTGQDIINLALPVGNLAPLLPIQVSAICDAVGTFADAFFRGRWGYAAVPLVTWDSSITYATAQISAFRIMIVRGLKPDASDWKIYKAANDEGMDFLNKVQRQQMHPLVTLANGNAPGGQQPNVISSSVVDLSSGGTAANRGW